MTGCVSTTLLAHQKDLHSELGTGLTVKLSLKEHLKPRRTWHVELQDLDMCWLARLLGHSLTRLLTI